MALLGAATERQKEAALTQTHSYRNICIYINETDELYSLRNADVREKALNHLVHNVVK